MELIVWEEELVQQLEEALRVATVDMYEEDRFVWTSDKKGVYSVKSLSAEMMKGRDNNWCLHITQATR